MKRTRLQDHLLPLCGTLLINVVLFMGVAVLCQEDAPEQTMTASSPISLASGTFTLPSRSAAERPQDSAPESASSAQKIPLVPPLIEPGNPSEPVADIEVPELQHEIAPDLLAVKIPQPVQQPKQRSKQARGPIQKPQPASKESARNQSTGSATSSTTSAKKAGDNSGETAGGRSSGDLGSREFGLDEVDRGPQILKQLKPAYPLLARRRNLSGKVVVKFLVDRHGKVLKPKIIEAHPQGVFEQSVLDSISQWRFKPGVYKGREVSTWVVLPIQFRLTGG